MEMLITDAGRSQSRRPKQKNDCAVRAVATVLGMPYDDAYDLFKDLGRRSHRGFDFKAWANRHPRLRWISVPAVKGEKRMSHSKFCREYGEGRYILREAKHVSACVNGVVHDINPPYEGRCIYGVWRVL